MDNKPSIGAIWKKVSKKGTEFLSLSLAVNPNDPRGEKVSYVAFANTFKSDEKQPDFKIYLSEPMTGSPQSGQSAQGTQVQKTAQAALPIDDEVDTDGDDTIPF